MKKVSSRTRRVLVGAAVGGLAVTVTPAAFAQISGTVVTANGAHTQNVQVKVQDSSNPPVLYGAHIRGDGTFTIPASATQRMVGPLSLTAEGNDPCLDSRDPDRTKASPPVATSVGATGLTLTLPLRPFCNTLVPSGASEATASVDSANGMIFAPANGVAYLRVMGPSDGQNFTMTTADGTAIGQGQTASLIKVTTPAAYYDGPINLNYTLEGAPVSVPVGTLRSGKPPRARVTGRSHDLASIIDMSESMAGSIRSRTAMELMIELSNPGDRLLAEGLASKRVLVLGRTTITNANKARVRKNATRRIRAYTGATDYNAVFERAYNALSASPLRPEVPKSAIFFVDGPPSVAYNNGHMRFVHNGTGVPWPVCVVHLGRAFQPSDVVRLKRIARDTGGVYLRATREDQLEALFFRCRGANSGARTVLRKTNTFGLTQRRTVTSRVPRKQANATFLVSWSSGLYQLRLFQPGRATPYTRSQSRKVRVVKGRTFQYFSVNNPRAGRWRLEIRRIPTAGRTQRVMTTVNVQRTR